MAFNLAIARRVALNLCVVVVFAAEAISFAPRDYAGPKLVAAHQW
jgi:hypothetical protein